MGEYGGETISKKIARVRAYSLAHACMGGQPDGLLLALAGPEARDADVARAFWAIKGEHALFVDTEPDGLRVAQSKLPGCGTHLGYLKPGVVPGPVALAVLDFCGSVETKASREAMASLRGLLRRGSAVIVTYLRARERPWARRDRMLARFERSSGPADPPLASVVRSKVALEGLAQAVGLPAVHMARKFGRVRDNDLVLVPMFLIDYWSKRSPMGMLVVVVRRWFEVRKVKPPVWVPSCESSPRELLSVADLLDKRGVDPSLALSVKPGTLAAWRAHRTMGTYGSAA